MNPNFLGDEVIFDVQVRLQLVNASSWTRLVMIGLTVARCSLEFAVDVNARDQ